MIALSKSILIVDKDGALRDSLADTLRNEYSVLTAQSGEEALEVLHHKDVHLVTLDVKLPGISGLELLRIVKENYGLTEVVVVSAAADVADAVDAIKHGAYHFATKDLDREQLLSIIRHAAERQDLNRQVITLSAQVADESQHELVLGSSKAMRDVADLALRVAKLSATILIRGESGTGKELVARMIHRESGRTGEPFIAVNLAAIPNDLVESTLFGHENGALTGAYRQQLGKFELAAGGTLFLDEIGDLRPELQAKLLRAIQEYEIERVGGTRSIKTNFRLVVATNVDLEKAVADGSFRSDLYYRINVVPIRLPALRERAEDIPLLVHFFLQRYSTRFRKDLQGISDTAVKFLSDYWWPGNVRELENLIERLVAMSDKSWITEDDLPLEYHLAHLDAAAPADGVALFNHAIETFERNFLLRSLEKQRWNVSATARYLGVPLSTLKHKIGRLDVRQIARRLRAA